MSDPKKRLSVASLFAGAGGLDLGFTKAGFEVTWANEFDKTIWPTYEKNFRHTNLDKRSIIDIDPEEIPDVHGFIGGPPCQSWSEAGSSRGIKDHRGRLFYEYLRLLKVKRPVFFLAENVSGILFEDHRRAFKNILDSFADLGYNVSYGLLNANDYCVPQDRQRVVIVGYRVELESFFVPPETSNRRPTLRDAIHNLTGRSVAALDDNSTNPRVKIRNHEYMTGGFSPMFLSRNRVRGWNEPSFTIQAGARHAPLHPQAPKMEKIGVDSWRFQRGSEKLYRRLTVRECARIQTFPDSHEFIYRKVSDGYKMVGNAVPVEFARQLSKQILLDVAPFKKLQPKSRAKGQILSFAELLEVEESA